MLELFNSGHAACCKHFLWPNYDTGRSVLSYSLLPCRSPHCQMHQKQQQINLMQWEWMHVVLMLTPAELLHNWQQQQQHWLEFHEDRWESSYGGNIYFHFCTSVCDCCLGHVFNGMPCNCGIRYCTILCPHYWNFHSRWHLLPFLPMPLCGNCSHKCSSFSARFYKETAAINL